MFRITIMLGQSLLQRSLQGAAIAVLTWAGSGSLRAYDVNKDLRNLGPPAHDLSVILSGVENVIGHFDGYTSGPIEGEFGTFATGPDGPNTKMKWDNFSDSQNQSVDTGQTIHVGWSTSDHSSNIKDMYWTDETGGRIPGSTILNITSGWRYETSGQFWALFENDFQSEIMPDVPVFISDLQFAILPGPIPLAALNAQNTDLEFEPVIDFREFLVEPGESIDIPLLEPVLPGSAVILRYGVTGPQTMAESLDFVQIVARNDVGLRCDLNGDGAADAADAGLMFSNWGGLGFGDCTEDGIVDAADAGVLFSVWTGDGRESVAAVPEPIAGLLLACGWLPFVARRQKRPIAR